MVLAVHYDILPTGDIIISSRGLSAVYATATGSEDLSQFAKICHREYRVLFISPELLLTNLGHTQSYILN